MREEQQYYTQNFDVLHQSSDHHSQLQQQQSSPSTNKQVASNNPDPQALSNLAAHPIDHQGLFGRRNYQKSYSYHLEKKQQLNESA